MNVRIIIGYFETPIFLKGQAHTILFSRCRNSNRTIYKRQNGHKNYQSKDQGKKTFLHLAILRK